MAATPLVHIDTLDIALEPFGWDFAHERRGEIDAHFAKLRRERPALWNGRVLMMHRQQIEGGTLRGACFETDFASFIAWRDWGFPDGSVKNFFGLGALQGADGGYVLGVMGAETSNAGRIYFPGGTPDPSDLTDGKADLDRSVRREVQEETGLNPSEFDIEAGWHCLVTGPMIALLKPMRGRESAAGMAGSIERHIRGERNPELAGVAVVRGLGDLDPKMPAFIQAFFRAIYS